MVQQIHASKPKQIGYDKEGLVYDRNSEGCHKKLRS